LLLVSTAFSTISADICLYFHWSVVIGGTQGWRERIIPQLPFSYTRSLQLCTVVPWPVHLRFRPFKSPRIALLL